MTGTGTILILEDDEGIATLVRNQVTRLGLSSHSFTSPDAAAEYLRTAPNILLFVLDLRLRDGRNGLDFYRRCLAEGFRSPAILTTGYADERIMIEALRCGVRDVILKTGDFVEHLYLTIPRVLDEQRRDEELSFLRSEREVRQRIQGAFEAAQVMSWSWSSQDLSISWAGHLLPPLGRPGLDAAGLYPLKEFFSSLEPAHQRRLTAAIMRSRGRRAQFECEVLVGRDSPFPRWWLLRGRTRSSPLSSDYSCSGVAIDVTERHEAVESLERTMVEVQTLNERLTFSVTETHHRVKNSLQIVSSLMSIELRRHRFLSEEGLRKMLGHVRALASLHDLLTDSQKDGRDLSHVKIDDFLSNIVEILKRLTPKLTLELEPVGAVVPARTASALAVVVVELVMNAAKYGEKFVRLRLRKTEDGFIVEIENDCAPMEPVERPSASTETKRPTGTGLEIVDALLANDLSTTLSVERKDSVYRASFSVPSIRRPDVPVAAF